jgi:hypothetical protein
VGNAIFFLKARYRLVEAQGIQVGVLMEEGIQVGVLMEGIQVGVLEEEGIQAGVLMEGIQAGVLVCVKSSRRIILGRRIRLSKRLPA